MKFNMYLKTLIVVISTACVIAGTYYTTEARLDAVEQEISWLSGQIRTLKAENKFLKRRIIQKDKKGNKKGGK